MKRYTLVLILVVLLGIHAAIAEQVNKSNSTSHKAMRWSSKKANQWYAAQPWLVGCNFIPSTAINQLEMWQANTFDPEMIDRELGWAAKLGFNVVRVYLHDLAYEQDSKGFMKRMDHFLKIADKHDIRTMFVIFDDCWLADPKIGEQPEPLPGVHNSGWLESPGLEQLKHYPTDAKLRQRLERYVTSVIEQFRNDKRILMWDLYNEPGGWWYRRGDGAKKFEKGLTGELCLPLLKDVYTWARQVNPSQPLTSCWNRGDYEVYAAFNWADVTTFHHYGNPASLNNLITKIKKGTPHRPIICTEYLRRAGGDTFQATLPVLQKHNIGAINWGLVAGKTNTMWGWASWENFDPKEPKVWFHDILRKDGTPFDKNETAFLKSFIRQGREEQNTDLLTLWPVDPLIKVFKDAQPRPDTAASALAARGETATFQLVVKSNKPLSDLRINSAPLTLNSNVAFSISPLYSDFVGFVPISKQTPAPDKDQLRKPPADYPDPLLKDTSIDL